MYSYRVKVTLKTRSLLRAENSDGHFVTEEVILQTTGFVTHFFLNSLY